MPNRCRNLWVKVEQVMLHMVDCTGMVSRTDRMDVHNISIHATVPICIETGHCSALKDARQPLAGQSSKCYAACLGMSLLSACICRSDTVEYSYLVSISCANKLS